MLNSKHSGTPLISVIITCYNHGHFLAEAIESVLAQNWNNKEIIVIDDGSDDHTSIVAQRYAEIKYIHQHNKGLSAARNAGVKHSSGDYLLFLDADDWLLPDALQKNLEVIQQNEACAFASGSYTQFVVDWNKFEEPNHILPSKDHFLHLLEKNYIAMHATVMYKRWVFDEFMFDTSLQACEDYDLYLRIARKYPIVHHKEQVAVYRIYNSSMSGNGYRMLTAALAVMNKHRQFCKSKEEVAAWHRGVAFWRWYYGQELYYQLHHRLKNNATAKGHEWKAIFASHKLSFLKLSTKTSFYYMKKILKHLVPVFGKRWIYKAGITKAFTPPPGKVASGDLHRLQPLSILFGYDRGGPVDRYYIEQFLQQQKTFIKGRVLEIGDDSYSKQCGSNITQQDVLHVDKNNKQATIVGDLSHLPQIADNTFDCIILTQTLHLIYDFDAAIATCYRILKPGGNLLLTVPGITPIDHGAWKETWYWAFTDKAIERVLQEQFLQGKTTVRTYGNVYVATAFLYGMGMPDVSTQELEYHDPHYQVIIASRAEK